MAAEEVAHAEFAEEREVGGTAGEGDVEILIRLRGARDEPRVVLENHEVARAGGAGAGELGAEPGACSASWVCASCGDDRAWSLSTMPVTLRWRNT